MCAMMQERLYSVEMSVWTAFAISPASEHRRTLGTSSRVIGWYGRGIERNSFLTVRTRETEIARARRAWDVSSAHSPVTHEHDSRSRDDRDVAHLRRPFAEHDLMLNVVERRQQDFRVSARLKK